MLPCIGLGEEGEFSSSVLLGLIFREGEVDFPCISLFEFLFSPLLFFPIGEDAVSFPLRFIYLSFRILPHLLSGLTWEVVGDWTDSETYPTKK